ncbi:hypothetical protein CO709_17520 [Burkholderia thailandensis]|uniref:hypothetical protein n=1 Tax=Burkholderia TaxID=32008 RepID=UPI0003A46C64|nr:hypothetical protein [Burkholderia humptydooensis]ATF35031.1 hypothetical protein CO709_17520 [Burkholderia thailandensis]
MIHRARAHGRKAHAILAPGGRALANAGRFGAGGRFGRPGRFGDVPRRLADLFATIGVRAGSWPDLFSGARRRSGAPSAR